MTNTLLAQFILFMLEIHAKTDVGLVRTNNEDYFFIDPDNRLIIVADGAGGYEYGEVASRLAVESCYQYLTREDYLQDTSDITQTLMDSITFANQQVIAYKKKHHSGSKMGTTLSCAYIGDKVANFAWMGDSRIFLINCEAKRLTQLSTDHTLYQEMLARGEVGESYKKSILSRMLGNNPYTRPDGGEAEIHKGELLLACSDGLSDMVSEERILEALVAAGDDREKGIDALIDLAKGQGGRDNITVAIAELT